MKVYKQTKNISNHSLFVQPGIEHPENSNWIDSEKKPKMFTVTFKYGVAEVESGLGNYLIDRKLAASTQLVNVNGDALWQ